MRIFFLHPTFSDENFYFNVAKNFLNGKTIYKEIFLAHPPFQIYTLSFLFLIFGSSLQVAKILPLLTSSISTFLIFLICKKLYNEKVAFLSSLLFLFSPPFLSFSLIEQGFFPTLMFILLSFYFLLKEKTTLASISFTIATFFRFHTVFYILFFIFFLYYFKRNEMKKFVFLTIALVSVTFILFLSIYGNNFFKDTILYHINTKILLFSFRKIFTLQYWSMNFFFMSLAIISLVTAIEKKQKMLFFFSVMPILIDFIILLLFQPVFYHYFLLSLPFYVIAISSTFFSIDDKVIKGFILMIFLLSIYSNFKTIDFYLNPINTAHMYEIRSFIESNINENETIFGEPSITNFISFSSDIRITADYLDSFLPRIIFDGKENLITMLENNRPKFFIDIKVDSTYYYASEAQINDFIQRNYRSIKNVTGTPSYLIYMLK
ncbi:MAG: glycosyltransferase family 39 protein [Candidatus Parvarchaeota archaeon]|nr:glycosyltransferase family 39 protein [Candidatus Jingweiarchaeum tengchongense]MCW1310846.1 glycosyltransferase family 39 protein [Candidatus Jingweiarchaeum tengchongense]